MSPQFRKCWKMLSQIDKIENNRMYLMATNDEFQLIFSGCRNTFEKKLSDYGPSWRIMRLKGLNDQIYIKINRIRTLQITLEHLIDEGIGGEFSAIVNYCLIALIQLEKGVADFPDISCQEAMDSYNKYQTTAFEMMKKKNHDYGEAWRNMSLEGITDIILTKLFRVKQIEENGGQTQISEGLDSNYMDMINYSIFALIKLSSNETNFL